MWREKENRDSLDLTSFLLDRGAYQVWFSGETEPLFTEHLKRAVMVAIDRELTDLQKEYLLLYVVERKTEKEIAEMKGVNKSSVSRGISYAKKRLLRCLRYSAPWLLDVEESPRNSQYRKRDRGNG